MQAIVTKYSGPTNHRGARIKATAHTGQGGSITVPWDYALDDSANHRGAAIALADKLLKQTFDWTERFDLSEGGSLPAGAGECFVLTRKTSQEA